MSSTFARYPKPRLRPFLIEVFSAWGCRAVSAPGVVEVELTRPLQKRFGRKKLRLLLGGSNRQSKKSGELMVPGNPVYRSVIELAGQKGGLGKGFVPMPKERRAASAVARSVGRAVKLNGASFRTVARDDVYHPILLFHFSLSYGAPEIPDEIRTVGWDVVAGAAVDPAPFASGGLSMAPGPQVSAAVEEVDDFDALFPRVQAALEAQVSKKVARTEARAGKQLDKETARIESFYRRMIEEEKSRPRSRNDGESEALQKIELYQLDWKRKLTEATERLKPRIGVRLFCIEEAFVPRMKAALIIPELVVPERWCFYDHLSKAVLGPSCDVCGVRSLELSICQKGHLCCSQCVGICRVCGRPFCQQCWSEFWGAARDSGGRELDPSDVMEMDPECAGSGRDARGSSSK